MGQFMADIRTSLSDALRAALAATGIDLPSDFQVGLERPARREHGDWSSNAALAIAKGEGRNPRELAAELAAWLEQNRPEHVAEVSVAACFQLTSPWSRWMSERIWNSSGALGRMSICLAGRSCSRPSVLTSDVAELLGMATISIGDL